MFDNQGTQKVVQGLNNETVHATSLELPSSDSVVKGQSDTPEANVDRPSGEEGGVQHSAPLTTLADPKVRNAIEDKISNTVDAGGEITDDVRKVVEAINPNDKTQMLNPAYFMQTAGRGGGVVYLPHAEKGKGPVTKMIEFSAAGLFVTTDIIYISALRHAIKTSRTLMFKETTVKHYNDLLKRGQDANKLRAVNGIVSAQDASANAGGPTNQSLSQDNERLKLELVQMREKVASLSQGDASAKPANSASTFFGNKA